MRGRLSLSENLFPPSDEGGGTRFARDGGREKHDKSSF